MAAGGEWIPATCSRSDLSILFGVSIRTIDNLIATGVVVPAEQRGMYQTLPTINAYLGDLRNKAAGRSKDTLLADERAKIAVIEREMGEIKLSQVKGEVLSLDEVVTGWSSILQRVKADLLAIPTLLRTQIPHFGAHEQETAKSLIRDVLNSLADEIEIGVVGTHSDGLRQDEKKRRPARSVPSRRGVSTPT